MLQCNVVNPLKGQKEGPSVLHAFVIASGVSQLVCRGRENGLLKRKKVAYRMQYGIFSVTRLF